jgi:hypothetical protein
MAQAKKRLKYHPEPTEIRDAAWKRGYLTPLELFRIQAWKSGQGLGSLTTNKTGLIEEVSQRAMAALLPWKDRDAFSLQGSADWDAWQADVATAVGVKRSSGLLSLDGMGYPRASAVLAILNPAAWPVIDRFAVQAVFSTNAFKWDRAAAYRAYAEHLATVGHRSWPREVTIHDVDMRAMDTGDPNVPSATLPIGWSFALIP